MGLTWYILGLLTTASIVFLWKFSKRYAFNWLAWSGFGLGVILVLFSIAWSVGAVLEGVPRAGSMGMLLFGLPGIVLFTFAFRYATSKLKKRSVSAAPAAAAPGKKPPRTRQHFLSKISPLTAGPIGKAIRIAAYLSLIAAFFVGMAAEGTDYEAMIRAKFEGIELTKVNDKPVVFKVDAAEERLGEYILITEGHGYGGPFVLGVRIKDDAKVYEVIPLSDKETPAFLSKIKEANYRDQFIGKEVSDNFIVGDDIDAVSGATITTMAAAQAVRNGAHTAAVQYFKLEPTWKNVPWKFGIDEILIIVLFGLVFVPTVSKKKPWKYLYLAASVAVVGFYLNASVSVGNFAGLLMGYVPGVSEHLVWWILVVGTVVTILISGANVYCYRICPFFGVELFLSKIGRGRMNPSSTVLRNAKFVGNGLLWAALIVIFLSRHPGLGAFEPFAMMFSLEGVGIQWYILPAALVGSFFISSFWCRFFCPCGFFLTNLRNGRTKLIKLINRNKR